MKTLLIFFIVILFSFPAYSNGEKRQERRAERQAERARYQADDSQAKREKSKRAKQNAKLITAVILILWVGAQQ